MPKASEYRSSAVQFDGALPFMVDTGGEVLLSTAAVNQGKKCAPCDGTIVSATAQLVSAVAGASGKLTLGNGGGASAYGSHTFATSDAAGVYDILAGLTSVTAVVTKGDVLEFNTDGGGTSGGLVAVTIVISPNAV